MPTFAYSGRTRTGRLITGERAGQTVQDVVAALRREQILVTRISRVKEKEQQKKQQKKQQHETKPERLGRKPKAKTLAVFTRQLSVMVDAGLPLVDCLQILGSQETNRRFAAVLAQTRTDIESGASLADAMRKHPKTFDPLFTNMIAAGEAGGTLDRILEQLAVHIEKALKLAGQVKGMMIYPAAVLSVATVIVGVVLWKVIPTFASLFRDLGVDLPLPTRIVIACSENLVRFFPLILAATAGAVWGVPAWCRGRRRRRAIDRMLLALPIVGGVLRRIAVARFCRTLATLIGSGVPILDGLEITARTCGNAVVEEAIVATRQSIEAGQTIAAPLGQTTVFPPMVVQMIAVGEASGALDTMLAKIADFYEQEVDAAAAGLLALLEPVTVTILGAVVGGIVIAMYLPIFDLIGKVT